MKYLVPFLLALLVAGPAFSDDDLDCAVIGAAYNPVEAGATNDHINLTDNSFGTSITADANFIVPTDIFIWRFFAVVDVAPGAGDTWELSVMDDGVISAVGCTISGTGTTCFSASNVVRTVEAGSTLQVFNDSGNGAGDPAAAAIMKFGFCSSRASR